ncbi:MAG TPA: hypothetical protein VIS94_07790 [Desulfomonilia bacterium]
MKKSMKRILILFIISSIFVSAYCSSVFAKTGNNEYEKGDKAVSSQVIVNNVISVEINREANIYCGNNSFSRNEIMLADNTGNQDPIDSSELDDPVDKTEVEDPIDRNDSEKNDPIDKEDRDNHPINSAEEGHAGQDNDGGS